LRSTKAGSVSSSSSSSSSSEAGCRTRTLADIHTHTHKWLRREPCRSTCRPRAQRRARPACQCHPPWVCVGGCVSNVWQTFHPPARPSVRPPTRPSSHRSTYLPTPQYHHGEA
jgi:hypothetical protein